MTVKELCEQYDLKPSALARRFEIPMRTVQQWYAGDRNPPVYIISMIKRILELEEQLDDLVLSSALSNWAEEEGNRLIEENERLKNDPNFQVPDDFLRACLDTINKLASSNS